jgi:hypothetical protein
MNHSKEYQKLVRHTIEDIVGVVSDFSYYVNNSGGGSITFRPDITITLQQITELSEALGTDAINFDFGNSGMAGYSEATPGFDGSPGEITIFLPITLKEDSQ